MKFVLQFPIKNVEKVDNNYACELCQNEDPKDDMFKITFASPNHSPRIDNCPEILGEAWLESLALGIYVCKKCLGKFVIDNKNKRLDKK